MKNETGKSGIAVEMARIVMSEIGLDIEVDLNDSDYREQIKRAVKDAYLKKRKEATNA